MDSTGDIDVKERYEPIMNTEIQATAIPFKINSFDIDPDLEKKVNSFVFLKGGRFALSWEETIDKKGFDEIEIYNADGSLYLTIPLDYREMCQNLIQLENGTIVAIVAYYYDSYRNDMDVLIKMINLVNDTFTIDSFLFTKKLYNRDSQTYIVPLKDNNSYKNIKIWKNNH